MLHTQYLPALVPVGDRTQDVLVQPKLKRKAAAERDLEPIHKESIGTKHDVSAAILSVLEAPVWEIVMGMKVARSPEEVLSSGAFHHSWSGRVVHYDHLRAVMKPVVTSVLLNQAKGCSYIK